MVVAPSSLRGAAFLQSLPIHNAFAHSFAPRPPLPSHTCTTPPRSTPPAKPARVTPRLTAAPQGPSGAQPGQSPVMPDTKAAPAAHPSVVDRPAEFWTDQWYPVAFADDVPVGKLHAFRLFDRPYVLFKDEATALYVVMDDVCPHRAVPLSEGRLLSRHSATILECAYHGWQFDCAGTCTAIPGGGPDFRVPAAAHIRALYATTVTRANIVFFFPGDRLRADAVPVVQPDLLQARWHPSVRVSRSYSRMLPLPYELLVENLVDPGHVPFAHHGTGEGNRDAFVSANAVSVGGQTLSARDDASGMLETAGNRSTFSITATVRGGGTSVITIVNTPMIELHLVFHIVPTARDATNFFTYRALRTAPVVGGPRALLARALRAMPSPRWIDHCRGHVVIDGDTPYLRDAEDALRATGKTWRDAYVLANGTWDVTVLAWRQWFDRFGHTMPYLRAAAAGDTAAMSARDINDRVRWHGRECVSCSGALRNFRNGRLAAAVVAVVAAAVAASAALLAGALAASGQPAVGRRVAWGALRAALLGLVAAAVVVGCQRGVTALTHTDKSRQLLNS